MKAYQSDDGEIRFYFDREDIAVHNLQFSDLITSSAKSKKLLAQLLQYAHEHFGFSPSGNHLTIGAIPLGKDHLLLTLSDKDVSGKLSGRIPVPRTMRTSGTRRSPSCSPRTRRKFPRMPS